MMAEFGKSLGVLNSLSIALLMDTYCSSGSNQILLIEMDFMQRKHHSSEVYVFKWDKEKLFH